MTEKISIISVNCQGWNDRDKRRDVLNYLKSKKFSIYFLQDTHFTKNEENYIRSQWGYESYFNSHTSQSRGVAIFINNTFEYKFLGMQRDDEGNMLVLDILAGEKKLTLFNIYGPNKDTPDFYKNLCDKISK